MAESFSVTAMLTAYDKGFTSGMQKANKSVDTLGAKIKSGIGFGILIGVGQKAFSTITAGARDLIGEIDSANAAWKTFDGNMRMIGKNTKQINKTKKSLQKFAEQTIYSSSDMATTYSQLAAVGTKNTTKLVKGFGGLAASAEDPIQAMKTLSVQGTQMAAKPKVAWMDFKLMLEQTPAGIAAVAKEMKMSTKDLVTAVQDGEVKTQDFFDAIAKAGTNDAFTKLATSYKTAGQAMDGLKETVGNKLTPAFDILSERAIDGISGIIDKISEIDEKKLAKNLSEGLKKAEPYFKEIKDTAAMAGKAIKRFGKFLLDNSDTISKALPYIRDFGIAFLIFKVINKVAPGMMKFAKGITMLAGKGIGTIAAKLFGIAGAERFVGETSVTSAAQVITAAKSFLLMGVAVLAISAGFALLAYSAVSVAKAGPMAIGVLFGLIGAVALLGIGMVAMLKILAPMATQLMPVATAMLIMGTAVVLVAAGFALLAYSAISLANAGGLAIGVMVGMVSAIALIAVGMAALGPVFTASAVGLLAFGTAVLMVGAGALLASAGLALIADKLPMIVTYGLQGAACIVALGAGLMLFAVGAVLAGAAAAVLGVGLVAASAGILTIGVAAMGAAIGVLLLAGSAGALGSALMLSATAVMMIAMFLPMVSISAGIVAVSFTALMAVSVALASTLTVLNAPLLLIGVSALTASVGILAFAAGMLASSVGVLVLAVALKAVKSNMRSINLTAKSTQRSLNSMVTSINFVGVGLEALGSKVKSVMNMLVNTFNNTSKKAINSGQKLGNGFTKGMQGGLNKAPSIATSSVNRVNANLRKGRSGAYNAGAYISKGFALGMKSCLGEIESAATQMVSASDKAIRAKAKIHSPSKLSRGLGRYWGGGYELGIIDKIKDVRQAAKSLISIPNIMLPRVDMAYAGGTATDYEYYRNSEYIIEVPLNVDGKEFARATASYTQEELDKMQSRESRKRGKR